MTSLGHEPDKGECADCGGWVRVKAEGRLADHVGRPGGSGTADAGRGACRCPARACPGCEDHS